MIAKELAQEALRLKQEAEHLKWVMDETPVDRGGSNGPRGRAVGAFHAAEQAATAAMVKCCVMVAGEATDDYTCRDCGAEFVVKPENFAWQTGRPETIRLYCPTCGTAQTGARQ